jgi:RecA/RadA recombinase
MYIDTESSMSERRMKELGMDVNKTIYVVPDCLED